MAETDLFSFASDVSFAYPSERVKLFMRPAFAALPGSSRVQISVPKALRVESFMFCRGGAGCTLLTSEDEQNAILSWQLEMQAVQKDEELVISIEVERDAGDGFHSCSASLLSENGETLFESTLRIKIKRSAETFRYLPEIYRRDDFANRFLMLFESFWNPMSRQINQGFCYYDPHLTPSSFLPWLASWFGLEMESGVPEERRRDLISMIMPIYGQKGTRQTLSTILSLYSGGEVQIVEYLDENLVLGKDAHLGYQIALGKQNRPHSFDVCLKVPDAFVDGDKDERVRHEQYRKRIAALIDSYKPAQTVFRLEVEFI
jgi:phage tail-like protein